MEGKLLSFLDRVHGSIKKKWDHEKVLNMQLWVQFI